MAIDKKYAVKCKNCGDPFAMHMVKGTGKTGTCKNKNCRKKCQAFVA